MQCIWYNLHEYDYNIYILEKQTLDIILHNLHDKLHLFTDIWLNLTFSY